MKRFKVLGAVLFMSIIGHNANAQVKKTTTTAKKTAEMAKPTPTNSPVATTPIQPDAPNPASIRVKITTDSGTVIVKLYDSTPLHRDNFVKLVRQGFYDSLVYHRVIPGFMIQGGDPQSKNAPAGSMLGNGGSDMQRIPAEFRPGLIHKYGALAAARDNNPQKASSACQFYLVQGKKLSDQELTMLETNRGKKYTPAQKEIYKTQGGTPFLDQEYTVFGEVESGLEVIDKIAGVPQNNMNRPLGDVRMHMEVIE